MAGPVGGEKGVDLKRFPATGKCRVDLSFSVNVEGSPATLEKRTIQSVEFDDVPRRWFRVRVSSHANRILLFVTQAATTGDGGFLPDSEGVARDPGGYLAGHTDGKAYHLQSGETFSSLVLLSPSRLNPEPYETGVTQEMILYDMVEFRKSDPTEGLGNFQVEVLSAEFEAQPLSEYNTFTTDENGIAILYISSKGRMADEDYIPDILDFELTGSTTFFGRLFATADWFNARMVQCGKAVLTGTEGLGSGAGWHEKAVAWASEVIPFASDLRTLAFEIYKGASGCDNVNWYNVGFSAISLVADCFTLGAAKGITAPLKLGVLGGKALLKSMAVSVVVGSGLEVAGNALAGYMERIGKEAAKQADDTPAWAGRAGGFLNFVEAKMPEGTQTDFGRNFFGAMGSVNDVDDLAKTHDTLGEGEFVEFMAMEVPEDIK